MVALGLGIRYTGIGIVRERDVFEEVLRQWDMSAVRPWGVSQGCTRLLIVPTPTGRTQLCCQLEQGKQLLTV
jgi:hypothetical protein